MVINIITPGYLNGNAGTGNGMNFLRYNRTGEKMINKEDILTLSYYSYGQAFTGSEQGMRYRVIIQKEEKDEDGSVVREKGLMASVWPEPFSYDQTPQAQIETKIFAFSEDGREELVSWLNEMFEKGHWQPGFTMSQLKRLREGDI